MVMNLFSMILNLKVSIINLFNVIVEAWLKKKNWILMSGRMSPTGAQKRWRSYIFQKRGKEKNVIVQQPLVLLTQLRSHFKAKI